MGISAARGMPDGAVYLHHRLHKRQQHRTDASSASVQDKVPMISRDTLSNITNLKCINVRIVTPGCTWKILTLTLAGTTKNILRLIIGTHLKVEQSNSRDQKKLFKCLLCLFRAKYKQSLTLP